MKRSMLTYCLLLLLSTAQLFGQDTLLVPQVKVDSIKHLIDTRGNNDKQKVRLLNEYARMCFYNQEYKKGLDAAIESREISDEINFEGGYAMYDLTLSAFVGEGLMSNYLLHRALKIVTEINKVDLVTDLDYPSGYPHPRNSQLLGKMLEIKVEYLERDEKEVYAYILDLMTWCNLNIRDYVKLNQLYYEAIEIFKELNLIIPLLHYYNYQARRSRDLGIRERANIIRNKIDSTARSYLMNTQISDYEEARLYKFLEQPSLAIKYYSKSMNYYKSINRSEVVSEMYNELDDLYGSARNYPKQAETCESWIQYLQEVNLYQDLEVAYWNLYNAYLRTEEYNKYLQVADSALHYSSNKEATMDQIKHMRGQQALVEGRYQEALKIFEERYQYSQEMGYPSNIELFDLAKVHLKLKDYKKAKEYISEFINRRFGLRYNYHRMQSLLLAYDIYKNLGRYDKALEYLKDYQERRDELVKSDYDTKMSEALLEAEMERKQEEIEALEKEQFIQEQQTKIQRLWIVSILGALIFAIIIAFVLYRNNQNKQRANTKLKEQKEEIESTLEKLQATQSQLIQSEKMASLGELTAGIAHEIQNPLNFVNNFSELNDELLDDLKEAIANNDQEEIEAIYRDLKENENKIKHHGQRAEGIVKGMLMHSRASHGEKEPTDINALADEYLRLAYHGMRAKDKSFNADFKTDFDPNLPKLKVVPQDIGRVILNLINNAFYVVDKKSKEQIEGYKPEVQVSTAKVDGSIQISVKDNGPGIPAEIKDKIFQPFFTTKPTGQGTGLGLSLSYDIVKAHGGEIKVSSKDGEGTHFTIKIPIS